MTTCSIPLHEDNNLRGVAGIDILIEDLNKNNSNKDIKREIENRRSGSLKCLDNDLSDCTLNLFRDSDFKCPGIDTKSCSLEDLKIKKCQIPIQNKDKFYCNEFTTDERKENQGEQCSMCKISISQQASIGVLVPFFVIICVVLLTFVIIWKCCPEKLPEKIKDCLHKKKQVKTVEPDNQPTNPVFNKEEESGEVKKTEEVPFSYEVSEKENMNTHSRVETKENKGNTLKKDPKPNQPLSEENLIKKNESQSLISKENEKVVSRSSVQNFEAEYTSKDKNVGDLSKNKFEEKKVVSINGSGMRKDNQGNEALLNSDQEKKCEISQTKSEINYVQKVDEHSNLTIHQSKDMVEEEQSNQITYTHYSKLDGSDNKLGKLVRNIHEEEKATDINKKNKKGTDDYDVFVSNIPTDIKPNIDFSLNFNNISSQQKVKQSTKVNPVAEENLADILAEISMGDSQNKSNNKSIQDDQV